MSVNQCNKFGIFLPKNTKGHPNHECSDNHKHNKKVENTQPQANNQTISQQQRIGSSFSRDSYNEEQISNQISIS